MSESSDFKCRNHAETNPKFEMKSGNEAGTSEAHGNASTFQYPDGQKPVSQPIRAKSKKGRDPLHSVRHGRIERPRQFGMVPKVYTEKKGCGINGARVNAETSNLPAPRRISDPSENAAEDPCPFYPQSQKHFLKQKELEKRAAEDQDPYFYSPSQKRKL
uniref:Uncharacterized protein n=1 Tax=Panagrolaimus superbus TaxID=310955 RepID=A0A914YVU9_9BILA